MAQITKCPKCDTSAYLFSKCPKCGTKCNTLIEVEHGPQHTPKNMIAENKLYCSNCGMTAGTYEAVQIRKGYNIRCKICGNSHFSIVKPSISPEHKEKFKKESQQSLNAREKSSKESNPCKTSRCLFCGNIISKRATSCPKCRNERGQLCLICKRPIPITSSSCPECGDPDPFEKKFNVNVIKPKEQTDDPLVTPIEETRKQQVIILFSIHIKIILKHTLKSFGHLTDVLGVALIGSVQLPSL